MEGYGVLQWMQLSAVQTSVPHALVIFRKECLEGYLQDQHVMQAHKDLLFSLERLADLDESILEGLAVAEGTLRAIALHLLQLVVGGAIVHGLWRRWRQHYCHGHLIQCCPLLHNPAMFPRQSVICESGHTFMRKRDPAVLINGMYGRSRDCCHFRCVAPNSRIATNMNRNATASTNV